MDTQKTSHSLLLPEVSTSGSAPAWIHIMPCGIFFGRDGRGPYKVARPQELVAKSMGNAPEKGLPMDYDHQLEHSEKNGMPAPASGWIHEMEVREDGIWANVEWTEKGAAHVAGKEYRYVSPVFYYDKGGEVTAIESVALTNRPNLELKALASAHGASAELKKEKNMKALASMLGLNAEASESAVEGAVRELQEQNKALAAQAASPDPAKYVPMAAFAEIQGELAGLKAAQAAAQALALVDGAMGAGKISPAMEDWAKDYASKDAEGFKSWCVLAPDLRPGGSAKDFASAGFVSKGMPPDVGLSEAEKAIAAACGLDDETYKKAKG